MRNDKEGFLKTFTAHGIVVHGDSGDGVNFVADCPFSGKEKKLYINKETGQWDSKVAGKSGNHFTFLREFYAWCLKSTVDSDLFELAGSRKLPISAFRGTVARNPLNGKYLIPDYSKEGKIVGIGSWSPGSPGVFRTPNTKVQLNFAHTIKPGNTVYVCEGEWDFFALRWVIATLGKQETHKVVCVPGAGTFKLEWGEYFKGCIVRLCYDNDTPGEQGQVKARKVIGSLAESLQFINWSLERPDGFDIRDQIVEICQGREGINNAKKAFMTINSLCLSHPRGEEPPKGADGPSGGPAAGGADGPKEEEKLPEDASAAKMEEVVKKWLKMDSTLPLDVIYGTCFANRIDGDPVWMFIVAPPGGSKTEMLMTMNRSEWVETTTTLTAPALISGIKFPEGEDPSLLVKVNGKVLVIKDFTTILTMQQHNRDEIFGILRDVYDGYVEKFFGTGVKKCYKSKFGILAGVTPIIDAMSQSSALGERFLKFRINRFERPESEGEKIRKALGNVGDESAMRKELQLYAKALLRRKLPEVLPTPSEEQIQEITALAMFTASLRGSVTKDPYTGEMLCMPVKESGTRLAKQLVKLGIGVCVYRELPQINDYVMKIIRLTAEDTCPDRIMALIRFIWENTRTPTGFVKIRDLERGTHMSSTTVTRVIENLGLLDIVKNIAEEGEMAKRYRLTKRIENLITASKVFA